MSYESPADRYMRERREYAERQTRAEWEERMRLERQDEGDGELSCWRCGVELSERERAACTPGDPDSHLCMACCGVTEDY